MSDTPRTDANVVRGFDALRMTKDEEQWIRADVARQLERELASAENLLRRIAKANVIFPSMCANNMEAWNITQELSSFAASDAEEKK